MYGGIISSNASVSMSRRIEACVADNRGNSYNFQFAVCGSIAPPCAFMRARLCIKTSPDYE